MVISANVAHNVMMGMLSAVTEPGKEAQRLGRLVGTFSSHPVPYATKLLNPLIEFIHTSPTTPPNEMLGAAGKAVEELAKYVGYVLKTQAKSFNLSDAKYMTPEAHPKWIAELTGAKTSTTQKTLCTPLFNLFGGGNLTKGGFNPLAFMQQQAQKGELSQKALREALTQLVEDKHLPLYEIQPGFFNLLHDTAQVNIVPTQNGLIVNANGRTAAYVHNPWDANNPVHFTTGVSDVGNYAEAAKQEWPIYALLNELDLADGYLRPPAPTEVPLETLQATLPKLQKLLNQQLKADAPPTDTLLKVEALLNDLTHPVANIEGYLNELRPSGLSEPVKALVEQHLTTDNPNPKAFVQALEALVGEEAGKINASSKLPLQHWGANNLPSLYGNPQANVVAKLTAQALPHMPQVNALVQGFAEQTAKVTNPSTTLADTIIPLRALSKTLLLPDTVPSFINPNVLNIEAVGQPASALHTALHEATGLDLAKLAVANADTGLVNVEATREALDAAIAEGSLPNWQRLEQFPNRYQHTHPTTGEVTHVGLGNSIALNTLADGKGWTHLVPTPTPTAEGEAASNEAWQVLDPTSMIEAVQTKFKALGQAFDNAPPKQWQAKVIERVGNVIKGDTNPFANPFLGLKVLNYVDNLKTSGLTALEQVANSIPQKTQEKVVAKIQAGLKWLATDTEGATTFAQVRERMATPKGDEAL